MYCAALRDCATVSLVWLLGSIWEAMRSTSHVDQYEMTSGSGAVDELSFCPLARAVHSATFDTGDLGQYSHDADACLRDGSVFGREHGHQPRPLRRGWGHGHHSIAAHIWGEAFASWGSEGEVGAHVAMALWRCCFAQVWMDEFACVGGAASVGQAKPAMLQEVIEPAECARWIDASIERHPTCLWSPCWGSRHLSWNPCGLRFEPGSR